MKGKVYEMMFKFGARVNSSMPRAFSNTQKGIKATNSGLKRMQREAKLSQRAFTGFSGMFKTAFAGATAYMGFRAIKNAASETVDYAKAQIQEEKKLEAVLKNVKSIQAQGPEAYKKAKQELMGVASQLQDVGVIGDEVTLAGMQQLATFQMSQKEIGMLSDGMLDLLAQQKGLNASQQDAVNIGNMIGKVMNGQVGALSRVGISFTKAQEHALKTGDRMQRAAVLAEVLKQNVGGVNKALAETDQGQIQQMNNAWGDMKEEIGKEILPLQSKFARWFFTKIPRIQSTAVGAMRGIRWGIDTVAKGFNVVQPYINVFRNSFLRVGNVGMTTFHNIKSAVNRSKPAVLSVKTAFFNMGQAAYAGFQLMKPYITWIFTQGLPKITGLLVSIVGKAGKAANYIMKAWPVMEPVVLGVAGAFGVYKGAQLAALLITKGWIFVSGLATTAAYGFGSAIMFLTSPVGITVAAIGALIAIGWAVYRNWDTIKGHLGNVWEGIKNGASGVGGYISGVFQNSYNAVTNVFSGVGKFFAGVFNGVTNLFKGYVNTYISIANFMISGINKIKMSVPEWVPKIGGKVIGFSIPKVPMLAQGGIATGPTLAVVGEGRENEVIAPLSKLESFINSKILGGGQQGGALVIKLNHNPQIIVYGEASENNIQKALHKGADDLEKRFNRIIANKKRLAFG